MDKNSITKIKKEINILKLFEYWYQQAFTILTIWNNFLFIHKGIFFCGPHEIERWRPWQQTKCLLESNQDKKTTNWKSNTLCHTVFFHILIWLDIFLISLAIKLLKRKMSMNLTPLLFLPREYLLWKLLCFYYDPYKFITIKLYNPDEWFFDTYIVCYLLRNAIRVIATLPTFIFLFVYNFIQM